MKLSFSKMYVELFKLVISFVGKPKNRAIFLSAQSFLLILTCACASITAEIKIMLRQPLKARHEAKDNHNNPRGKQINTIFVWWSLQQLDCLENS